MGRICTCQWGCVSNVYSIAIGVRPLFWSHFYHILSVQGCTVFQSSFKMDIVKMLVLCKKAIFSYCCHSSANIIGAITKCCGLQLGCPLQCSPDLSELMLPQVLVKSKASQAPPRYPDLLHQIFMGEAWWSPTARPGFRCFAWISGVSLYLVLVFQSWQRKPSLFMQAFRMVFSQHVWHFPTL